MVDFSGKVVLITGAGKGTGRSVAEAFASAGRKRGCQRRLAGQPGRDGGNHILASKGQVKAYVEDIAKKMPIQTLLNSVLDDFGRIDILVNCAEVEPQKTVLEMDDWDWQRTMDVNLSGPFLLTQSVGRIMKEKGSGVIVHVGERAKRSGAAGRPTSPARPGWRRFRHWQPTNCPSSASGSITSSRKRPAMQQNRSWSCAAKMTVRLRDLLLGLRDLRLADAPVIVHSSLKSFGQVEGGAVTVVNALVAVFSTVIVPTFTYKTMITPLTGPENNGITYGSRQDQNQMAEFFTPRMPADPLMGIIPEMLRRHPRAMRSNHPIQSFAGINAEKFLASQTMDDHLAPLGIAGTGGRLGGADGRGPHRQHQHPLRRKTGRAQAIHPLGADTEGRGGVPRFPRLFSRVSRRSPRRWKSSPARCKSGMRSSRRCR